MSLVRSSLVALGVLSGCGGSDAASISEPLDELAAGDAPELQADAASRLPSPSSSSAVDAAGDDASATDHRIDPIEVGRAWTYDVTVLGYYPTCKNGVFTATTLQSSQLDGRTALHVQSLCVDAGTHAYAVDGDRVLSHFAGKWRTSLEAPVAEGYSWTDGFRDYNWLSRGSVTVAAGTFDDCWEAKVLASFDSYTVFCRGVGPVKWHYEDGFGNGYEAILVSTNF